MREGRGVTPAQEKSEETATANGTQDTSVAPHEGGEGPRQVLYSPPTRPCQFRAPVDTHGGGRSNRWLPARPSGANGLVDGTGVGSAAVGLDSRRFLLVSRCVLVFLRLFFFLIFNC